MKESDIQNLIRLDLSERDDLLLLRNNVGTGWQSNEIIRGPRHCVNMAPNDVLLRNARPLRAGLAKGAHDLIGWKTVTVTPDMVGQRLAIFTGVEVKTPTGRVRKDQKQFHETVEAAGGISVVARCVADVEGL
jgi:hypothetical protein